MPPALGFATQKTLGLLPEHVNSMVKKSLLGFALTAATTTVGYGTYKAFEKASDKTVTEKEQQMPEILPQAEKPNGGFYRRCSAVCADKNGNLCPNRSPSSGRTVGSKEAGIAGKNYSGQNCFDFRCKKFPPQRDGKKRFV